MCSVRMVRALGHRPSAPRGLWVMTDTTCPAPSTLSLWVRPLKGSGPSTHALEAPPQSSACWPESQPWLPSSCKGHFITSWRPHGQALSPLVPKPANPSKCGTQAGVPPWAPALCLRTWACCMVPLTFSGVTARPRPTAEQNTTSVTRCACSLLCLLAQSP